MRNSHESSEQPHSTCSRQLHLLMLSAHLFDQQLDRLLLRRKKKENYNNVQPTSRLSKMPEKKSKKEPKKVIRGQLCQCLQFYLRL